MKKLHFCFPLLLMGISLGSQTLLVPAEYETIQAAIDAAEAGDTVLVAEGTYYENINFLGKAITVASHFLIDGEESYISSTIIDGSEPDDPDKGSVVTMNSGEDTTSVLCGFTVTGGKGTLKTAWDYPFRMGGGIFIDGGGGKICNNIITNNHVEFTGNEAFTAGGAIAAVLSGSKFVAIRNNTVSDNAVSGAEYGIGAGIFIGMGTECILEHNIISGNENLAQTTALGGAISVEHWQYAMDYELHIRNNYIYDNIAFGNGDGVGGAFYGADSELTDSHVVFLNNVITNNYADAAGGGIFMQWFSATMINNTIYDNETVYYGNAVGGNLETTLIMWNNIVGSAEENGVDDFYFIKDPSNHIYLHSNYFSRVVEPAIHIDAAANTFLEGLMIDPLTFTLQEGSSAIGRGSDSIEIDGSWKHPPDKDLLGNDRPDPADGFVDPGAFESPYPRTLFSNADLAAIILGSFTISPGFHPDTLSYTFSLPDNFNRVEDLEAVSMDNLANIQISSPSGFPDGTAVERTATITVTSSDENLQKTYSVLFDPLSTDATLKELSVSTGEWNTEFKPNTGYYFITLPAGTTEVPQITAVPNDENANVYIFKGNDPNGTSRVLVRPEAGATFDNIYYLNFSVTDVGVYSGEGSVGISLYPNPWSNATTLELDDALQVERVGLYNILGERIRNIDHTQGRQITIERGDLAPGVYFLRVESNRTRVVRMLVQ